ncbi:MAG TPA: TlpA disulfide reductase family protein [Kofleriaceae bacterium]
MSGESGTTPGTGGGGGAGAGAGTGIEPAALEAPAVQAAAPGWLARLGLALIHPRWALAIAADRRNAGRSGSDLIAAIAVLIVATQLRGLASSVWLGVEVTPGFGVRAAMRVLTGALTVDLGLLLVGAVAVFALAGARRNLGRAFDLACVALVPRVIVELGATVAVRAAGVAALPAAASWGLSALSFGWMGALIALAIRPARSAARVPVPPAPDVRSARRVGAGVAAVAALGIAVQGVWIADHLELVKPITTGGEAPALALPRIGPGGALGEPVTLAASRGKVIVLDFWATWCGPCLAAMPRLDQLARAHPEVAVIAVNLDDAAAARGLFDQRGYTMTLVADDGDVSQRYGVSAIPHTVVIDRRGVVQGVVRGTGTDLARLVETLVTSE